MALPKLADEITQCKVGSVYSTGPAFVTTEESVDAKFAAEDLANSCVRSLEFGTQKPHYTVNDFFLFGPSGYKIYALEGCELGAHVNGEYAAKLCAKELSRITGDVEPKLVTSHWLWFNEYMIQKK